MVSHFRHRVRLVLFALALLFTLGGIGFIAPQAHAANAGQSLKTQAAIPQINTAHCSSLGNLIESEPIKARFTNTTIAEVDVYYNSTTGYNCAYLYAVGPAYGQAQSLDINIATCQEGYGSDGCTWIQHDEDGPYTYHYYAGPVGVYGKGHCIAVWADIEWQSIIDGGGDSPFVGHCG
ncbi:hypothetical protein [Tengunoibacter tsumagoiensis]|uniref:Uncharacterized protein n=1 Tax=Tengunoibacter tsumagoiensis TaxID=2014871 RepID=A0A402A972_9CHLR|nr:hypothetical protein [Tengunoibacter tsumagoiensis]GCE15546.1 hypothetical protein KTT_54050 [Tengunoibacter tsumagoiensis]